MSGAGPPDEVTAAHRAKVEAPTSSGSEAEARSGSARRVASAQAGLLARGGWSRSAEHRSAATRSVKKRVPAMMVVRLAAASLAVRVTSAPHDSEGFVPVGTSSMCDI